MGILNRFLRWIIALLFSVQLISNAWATPAQVLIIRHAEKPDSGDDLSPQGYARAQALAQYFQNDSQVTKYGTPVAIYAMGSGTEDSSKRPVETVTPLAQALGLSIHSTFQKNDIPALVSEILSTPQYNGKMVLICWEHKVITDIAAQFGVSPAPGKWPGDDFSTVYELDFSGNALSNFTTFSENVTLPDSSN